MAEVRIVVDADDYVINLHQHVPSGYMDATDEICQELRYQTEKAIRMIEARRG